MEDLGELVARGLLRAAGAILRALAEAVMELLLDAVFRRLARAVYGHGHTPWVRARRLAFRAVALGSSPTAAAVIRNADAPDGRVALAVASSLALLLMMCVGEEERGSPRLVWVTAAALALLLGTVAARVS